MGDDVSKPYVSPLSGNSDQQQQLELLLMTNPTYPLKSTMAPTPVRPPSSTRLPRSHGCILTPQVRLRHPRGVTNIEVDPEVNDIGDLKVIIFSATEIPPSEQDSEPAPCPRALMIVKLGYPPKPLPERSGPLGSLISRGEQLIVVAVPRKSPRAARRPSVKELDAVLSAPEPLPERASSGTRLAAQVGRTGTAEGTSVRTPAGVLELRVVPDDNSCLFSAVGVVFEGGIEAAQGLRKGECGREGGEGDGDEAGDGDEDGLTRSQSSPTPSALTRSTLTRCSAAREKSTLPRFWRRTRGAARLSLRSLRSSEWRRGLGVLSMLC
jgi:hypothetical protein